MWIYVCLSFDFWVILWNWCHLCVKITLAINSWCSFYRQHKNPCFFPPFSFSSRKTFFSDKSKIYLFNLCNTVKNTSAHLQCLHWATLISALYSLSKKHHDFELKICNVKWNLSQIYALSFIKLYSFSLRWQCNVLTLKFICSNTEMYFKTYLIKLLKWPSILNPNTDWPLKSGHNAELRYCLTWIENKIVLVMNTMDSFELKPSI